MHLSKNFTLAELTKSQTAIRLGIDNTPSEDILNNLKGLVENVLQPLRDFWNRPITVSSGYRSVELNKTIGGSNTSEHCKGYAADIEIIGVDNRYLFEYIKKNMKFTQLILEFYEEGIPDSGWIHLSFNPDNLKCESLIASKKNGRTVYSLG